MQEDAVAQGAGFFVDNALQYGKTEEGQCLHQRHVNGGKEKGGGHTGGKNADSLSEDVVEEALEEAVKDAGEKAASAVFSPGSSVRQMSSRTFLMGTNIRRESLRAIRSLGFAD